jgi:DNA-binding response OmpR family regulator
VPIKPKIVVVEDDPALASLLCEYLSGHGFSIEVLPRAAEAVRKICALRPDLVVLDIMLPDGSGLDICRDLRKSWSGPVIFLTALDEDTDVVVGLELGADDYIPKPVSPRVLLARIRALLRRNSGDAGAEAIVSGSLRIDFGSRTAFWEDRAIDLTTTEFDLLGLLARRAGRVQERSHLVEELRGIDFSSFDRSVDVIVSRIRRKLEAEGACDLIRTVRGVGYMLAVSGESK